MSEPIPTDQPWTKSHEHLVRLTTQVTGWGVATSIVLAGWLMTGVSLDWQKNQGTCVVITVATAVSTTVWYSAVQRVSAACTKSWSSTNDGPASAHIRLVQSAPKLAMIVGSLVVAVTIAACFDNYFNAPPAATQRVAPPATTTSTRLAWPCFLLSGALVVLHFLTTWSHRLQRLYRKPDGSVPLMKLPDYKNGIVRCYATASIFAVILPALCAIAGIAAAIGYGDFAISPPSLSVQSAAVAVVSACYTFANFTAYWKVSPMALDGREASDLFKALGWRR